MVDLECLSLVFKIGFDLCSRLSFLDNVCYTFHVLLNGICRVFSFPLVIPSFGRSLGLFMGVGNFNLDYDFVVEQIILLILVRFDS